MKILCNVTLTAVLAVWGATVATLVLCWDIIKWKTSGPKVSFSASPNMNIYNIPRVAQDKTFIVGTAVNKGVKPTTITNLGWRYYNNWFDRLRRKSAFQAVIGNTALQPLPHVLQPGTIWKGLADQGELEQDKRITTKKGILIFELYLSHSDRPKRARVQLKS